MNPDPGNQSNASITIEYILSNSLQGIKQLSGLSTEQKTRLTHMVQSLSTEIDTIKSCYPDEARKIAEALHSLIALSSDPARKGESLLGSAKYLIEQSESLREIAPALPVAASLIAHFTEGL